MTAVEQRPLLARAADFPLVAMVVAIVLLMLASGLATGLLEVGFRSAGGAPPEWLRNIVGAGAMVLAYKFAIRHLGRELRDDLAGPRAGAQLFAGIGIGFVLFSLIVLTAAIIGTYGITGPGNFDAIGRALINEGMFPAVTEELLFRAILFRWLEEFAGSWAALAVSSALFGLSHLWNPGGSWVAAGAIAVEAGVMLGAAYMLTRRLWLPIGIHGAWNVSQGEIYDIPVSGIPADGIVEAKLQGPPLLTGGGFGLEASLITMVIATLFGCFLLWLAAKRGSVVQPMWTRRRLNSYQVQETSV